MCQAHFICLGAKLPIIHCVPDSMVQKTRRSGGRCCHWQPKRILRSPLTKSLDNSVEYSMDMGSDKNASHDWPLSNPPFLPLRDSTMYAIKNAPNYHTLSIRIGDVGLDSRLPWSSNNGTPLTNKDSRGPLLPLPIVHPLFFFFCFVSLNPHISYYYLKQLEFSHCMYSLTFSIFPHLYRLTFAWYLTHFILSSSHIPHLYICISSTCKLRKRLKNDT